LLVGDVYQEANEGREHSVPRSTAAVYVCTA